MSKIEELIQQYCPDGVEYVKLGEIGIFYGGLSGKSKKDFVDGNAKFISYKNIFNNIALDIDTQERVKISPQEKQNTIEYADVLFTGSSETPDECGMSSVLTQHTQEKLYLNSFCFGFRLHNKKLFLPDFLKHLFRSSELRAQIKKTANGTTRFNVSKAKFALISIPIPPLAVQEEIVRILDKFSLLTAELEAELELRRKQYDFYRNLLLSFDSDSDTVQWKKLGEVAELIRGGNFQKKDFTEVGIPCIHYGQIYTHFGIHTTQTIKCVSKEIAAKSRIAKQNDIVMAITSENVEDVGKCVAWLGNEDIAVSGHTVIIHHNQNAKYLSYFFHTEHFAMQKKKMAHGTKVIEISPDALNKTIIPIPPLSEQQRIVDILDRFDALVNDLSAGLPAEIEARRKQYEYYRDTLLNFKRKAE